MKVAILGAGIIGTTTAWRLAEAGHEVTVIDSAPEVAQGASYANAGMIAPGHAYPWASPEALRTLGQSLLGRGGRLRITAPVDRELLRWGTLFVRECSPARARRNALVKLRLCEYSASLLHRWSEAAGIEYAAQRAGGLYLYRTTAGLRAAYAHSELFRAAGRNQVMLDAVQLRKHEPLLDSPPGREYVGAIFDPEDSSGDCAWFAAQVKALAEVHGAEFMLGRTVVSLIGRNRRVTAVRLGDRDLEADVFVLALGAGSARVARSIGERVAIYPVKGYVATFPLRSGAPTPSVAAVDQDELIAWSIRGDRLRMATGAEFAGRSTALSPGAVEPLLDLGRRLFPDLADYGRGEFRVGMRPMTPDSVPVIGRARRHENLILNTGHGHMGWTMACGSAELVCDLLAARRTALPLASFAPRWR
jgi:D-amino-acid dehydrogenase